MSVANAVVESMKRHKRKPSDFYPTPAAATVAVIPHLGLKPGALIGEPFCGSGDMSMVLEDKGFKVVSSDLRHTGYGLGGYDYFGENENPEEGSMGWLAEYGLLDAIVSNPPFALAEQAIRKATAQAPVVAFLLKSNYWHTANRVALKRDCPPTGAHELTWRLAFLESERGKSPLMDCTWFIWDKSKPPLPESQLMRPPAAEVPAIRYPLSVRLANNRMARERLMDLIG